MKTSSFKTRSVISVGFLALIFLISGTVHGQDKKDPTSESDIIKQTMAKIREVDKLDHYIEQNKTLTETNKQLQTQIASINKQVAQLTKDLAEQQAKLRKQLLQMPTFEVKAKILGNDRDMALLRMKEKDRTIQIRLGTKMSLLVDDGVYLLMEVKKISKEMVELHFPELERDLYLYD